MSHERMQGAVREYEGHVQSLEEELEFTRSNYNIACKEITDLKEELITLGSVQDQQQLLVLQVCGRVWPVGVVWEELITLGSVQDQQQLLVLQVRGRVWPGRNAVLVVQVGVVRRN